MRGGQGAARFVFAGDRKLAEQVAAIDRTRARFDACRSNVLTVDVESVRRTEARADVGERGLEARACLRAD